MIKSNSISFSEIFNFSQKSKIKAGEGLDAGLYPFYTSSSNLSKRINEFYYSSESLIFGTGGNASIHFCNEPFSTSTDCLVAQIKKENILTKYIYYFLKTNIYLLENGFKGAGLKHISKEYINNIQIPIISYPQQLNLIEKLSCIEELISKRKKSIELLDTYIQSTFYKMFGDPVKNEKGWKKKNIVEVCSKITDGTHKTPTYLSNGEIFVSAKNIKQGQLVLNDIKYISLEEFNLLDKRCNPRKGDILICKSGTIGMCTLLETDTKIALFESLALLKLITHTINGKYFKYMFNHSSLQRSFKKQIKGNSIKHLHLAEIKSIQIPLPPLPLQNQFAEIVEQVEEQKKKCQQSLEKLETLFAAVSDKAFKGLL